VQNTRKNLGLRSEKKGVTGAREIENNGEVLIINVQI
jgi:hypothetical protein